ncbi:hypothetical protein [Pedobacter sp. BMA]|uniref:hypothetical protein n=1 Tax=Pedobacter sp. BMA TaxID=1663685 RepID=UPI00064AD38E|nr:hypothetical protein [Pedobacter sp. BMA]KLT66672.1 membrane protein [Pedobacter sp. BMA]
MRISRYVRKISILFLLIIHLVFLFPIFWEHAHSWWLVLSLFILCPLIFVTYLRVQLHHHEHQYEHILVVAWIPIGAVVSFYLNHYLKVGPVISAAMLGTVASLIPLINRKSEYLKQLPAAIYCGAFIGMSSTGVAPSIAFVLTASFFTAVLIIVSKSLFSGLGGKLGTLAFAGVVMASLFYYLILTYA